MRLLSYFILLSVFFASCKDTDNKGGEADGFDREKMLVHWADNFIIPSFESYNISLVALEELSNAFLADPSVSNLEALRSSWLDSYEKWQSVSFYDIGKAEEIGLRRFTNIYPTDTALINVHIATGQYNLELPSTFDAQGFPALDFLLFGNGESDDDIVMSFSNANTRDYLSALVGRLNRLTTDVLTDWKSGYRDFFVSNSGSSGTASVDKLVNDYLFHYEKYLRAGKVGIPAGVFSGTKMANTVEARYAEVYSKRFFEKAFVSVKSFFNGVGQVEGESLSSYLTYRANQNNTTNVAESVNAQWNKVDAILAELPDNFYQLVLDDNSKMLQLYDELQVAVVLLKVEMMQALNIQVDYVDADGD